MNEQLPFRVLEKWLFFYEFLLFPKKMDVVMGNVISVKDKQ